MLTFYDTTCLMVTDSKSGFCLRSIAEIPLPDEYQLVVKGE